MARIIIKLRDDYVKKNNTAAVFMQLFLMRQKVTVNTGVYIPVDHWDAEKKQVKSLNKFSQEYNILIDKAIGQAGDILAKYQLMDVDLTSSMFKKEFINPTKYAEFFTWVHSEINGRDGNLTESTIVMHHSVIKSLKKFKKKLMFAEFDYKFIEKWEKWLKEKEGNSIATISKKMRVLKTYLNRALKDGMMQTEPFKKIKIKRPKGRIEYLTDEEIKKLIDLYHRESLMEGHRKVLRYFLFSCFTGLRLGDVKTLKHEAILGDTIVLVPKKKLNVDNQAVMIPLCKPAKKLIKDAALHRVAGLVFDSLSDQKTNKYIKELGKLVNIHKDLHFHISRHTFATLFLEKTGDLATLQRLMGHASVVQTMIYAHVSEQKKKKQIKIFDDYLQI